MKNLMIILFCLLSSTVWAQNRISTDTIGLRVKEGGIIRLPDSVQAVDGRSAISISKDSLRLVGDDPDQKLPGMVGEAKASAPSGAWYTGTTLDVSASGGAVYSLPFVLPPGINGVVPGLGLVYNSQGSNGIAGYGWTVSGLSTISRVAAVQYIDGRVGNINFNLDDRFALDGQRLLLKSGSYGADGAEYQTEQYSNTKVVSRGVSPYGAGYGPAYFEVYYPDGSKAFYGQTVNSRSQLQYAITYMENPQGVRISYSYTSSGNNLYISEVSYGSRGTTAGINRVIFNYAAASRAEQNYVGGIGFFADKRISKISVVANGQNYRHYVPTYSTVGTLDYQRMTQIQEFNGAENASFSPIYFTYNTTNNSITSQVISNLSMTGIASNNSAVVTGDYTGDGSMDFVLYNQSLSTRDKFYAFFDLDSSNPYVQWGYQINTGSFRDLFPMTWLTHNDKVLAGQGMLLTKENGYNKYKFDVYSAGTTSPVYYQYTKYWDYVPLTPGYYSGCTGQYHDGNAFEFEFVSGDFNGDGLTDVVGVGKNQTIKVMEYLVDPGNPRSPCYTEYGDSGSFAYFINMDRRKPDSDPPQSMLYPYFEPGDKLYAADFNGDGKTDILHVKDGQLHVYGADGGYFSKLWDISDSRIVIQSAKPILLGDYNGDGKMDVMFSTGYNNVFATFMSTGKSFVKHEKAEPFSNQQNTWDNVNTMKQYVLVPTDIDGDGKTDIVSSGTTTYNSTATGNLDVTVYHNIGIDASNRPLFGNSVSSSRSTNVRHNPIPVFLNPDQQNPDLEYGYISDNTISLFRFYKDMLREAQVAKVAQNGAEQYIDYSRLMVDTYANGLPIYQSSYEQTFPYMDIAFAPRLYVVNRTRDIYDKASQQTYAYAKGVTNAEGMGFLGYGETIRSNPHIDASDVNRSYVIGIQSPQLRGANLRTFVSKSSYINPTIKNMVLPNPAPVGGIADGATLSDYISRQDNLYQTSVLANKTFINVPVVTSSKDMLAGGTYANQRLGYDNFYNVVHSYKDNSGISTQRSGMTYANSTGASYYIGRLTNQKDTAQQGAEVFTGERQYTYTGYLPTQIKTKGHNTDFVTQNISYDVSGNITQRITVTANDGQRTENMEYDPSGRFMTKHTDPDNLSTNYVYNLYTGTLSTETDPHGRSTSYFYDTWDKKIKTTDYLGKSTTYSYISWGQKGLAVTQQADDGFINFATLNHFKKPTYQLTNKVLQGETGVVRLWEYDIYGRVVKASEPTGPDLQTTPAKWNNTFYDSYGRISQVESYTGRTSAYTYNGLTTTVNDGVKTVVTIKNALGQTSSVQDPGGTVNYSYYANGNLKSTDYGGSIQTMEQDGWGQKTQLIDPSAGTYQYSYDGWGQLKQETTPKGQTLYSYDTAGKPASKAITGSGTNMQWTYSYDAVSKLPTATALLNADGNNTNYTYAYDSYKRPSSYTEDNPMAKFQQAYTYDAFGRIATQEVKATHKATSSTVQKTVASRYQNGQKLQDSVVLVTGGEVLWRVDSLAYNGQLTTATQGRLRNSYSYDSFNLPQQSRLYRTSGTPATLMALGTTFDAPRGFPTARSNSAVGWSESFGYDNMDRLTVFNDNVGAHSQQYDSRGRIVENSRQGTYSYSGTSYRQEELSLNAAANTYYQSRAVQDISHNAFKSPIEIYEPGYDRLSFEYNGALGRSNMFYGGEQVDKLQRRYRKHYAEDGSAEITHDTQTGQVAFVLYLGGDAYSAPAIWKETTGSTPVAGALYYLHRDYLGSILMLTNQTGAVVEKRQFDAWGNIVKLTDGSNNNLSNFLILDRGYTGHEHLLSVGLIHMNGRLYDPRLGRFLAPDNYVQDPFGTQNFNRYGYALNNPMVYVDPDGEFFFVPVLVGMFWGAVIGAGTAAVAYSVGAAITGDWSWKGLGSAVAMGAVGGAIGGGFGALGGMGVLGSFGHSLGYNVLNQGANIALTNTIFGNEMTWGSLAGAVAGGIVGTVLPSFNAVKGSAFKNAMTEIGINTGRGAITGLASGAARWAVDGGKANLWQSAVGGAIGGASTTLFNLGMFGAARPFDDSYIPHGNNRPIHRGGGLISLFGGAGVSFGRTAWTNQRLRNMYVDDATSIHESLHYLQQKQLGFANFYGRTAFEYIKGFFGPGSWYDNVYNNPLTLEYQAMETEKLFRARRPYVPISN